MATVDLYWLPLGAGGDFVRVNGRLYEAVAARVGRRPACDLYHSALQVELPERKFVIEQAPVHDWSGKERGVVAEGAVGLRARSGQAEPDTPALSQLLRAAGEARWTAVRESGCPFLAGGSHRIRSFVQPVRGGTRTLPWSPHRKVDACQPRLGTARPPIDPVRTVGPTRR
jgi:hypothetical protein